MISVTVGAPEESNLQAQTGNITTELRAYLRKASKSGSVGCGKYGSEAESKKENADLERSFSDGDMKCRHMTYAEHGRVMQRCVKKAHERILLCYSSLGHAYVFLSFLDD